MGDGGRGGGGMECVCRPNENFERDRHISHKSPAGELLNKGAISTNHTKPSIHEITRINKKK